MTEYIERDALLEARELAICAYENAGVFNADAIRNHLKPLLDAVVDTPAADVAPVQKWISVKDRSPEEEGLYLVAVVNDHERRYSKTAWYYGHGNWFLHQKVTHWMLLPEPPKEE